MYQPDYDAAASVWIERDKVSAHMECAALKERIEAFIGAHNTCALATASKESVRNTPIEYNFVDGCFYFFSEGGLKFRGLKENKRVGIAIFESYGGFGQLHSLQVEGKALMVEPFSEEYLKLMEHKKIPLEAMKKLPQVMNLIKVVPETYDYLDSDLKTEGFGSRQHLEMSADR
ncbi:MAG: pyridoxamine 5'-phosphate oxidase family protein [Lachnospiraceae bacterium]|nr:pyridoxamine 5'-phosphate oxidase family protein [Lachnospiraceae bacterium]